MVCFCKRSCVVLLAAVLLAGCGGGSGGGGGGDDGGTDDGGAVGMTNADFFGNYGVSALSASIDASESESTWGQLTVDGVGAYSAVLDTNVFGTVVPGTESGAYVVASDGALTVDGTRVGGLTGDGSIALLSEIGTDEGPSMLVGVRRTGTGYSNAVLTGSYHFGLLWTMDNATQAALWTTLANGYVMLDGVGAITYPTLSGNNGGTPISGTEPMRSYSLSPSGVLSIESPLGDEEGTTTPDGSFVVSAGTESSANMSVSVFLRTAASASAATFSGSYWVIGMSSDPSDSARWTSFNGTVTADGAGAMSYAKTTENLEGDISTPSGPDTYTVSPNGTLTSGDRLGAVSADGRYAYLSGSTVGGGTPMLFIFVRK